jgi:hypothetical protein
MRPGLAPLGTDFGNGPRDGFYFQLDRERPRYLVAERAARTPSRGEAARCELLEVGDSRQRAHETALRWLHATSCREVQAQLSETLPREEMDPGWDDASPRPRAERSTVKRYASILDTLQEDAVLMFREPHQSSEAIMVNVCLPSSWRPEQLLGKSFRGIHALVPDFAKRESAVRGLEDLMFERGPFVRFVWTVTADDALDQHPDRQPRASWSESGATPCLRVERQISVPFKEVQASLFIIRVFLYRFDQLSDEQRRALQAAIRSLPEEVARFKNLEGHTEAIAAVLSS